MQPNDHFSICFKDIRVAGNGKIAGTDAVFGITISTAPTLEDPSNNTLCLGGFRPSPTAEWPQGYDNGVRSAAPPPAGFPNQVFEVDFRFRP
jgi:hypothetical protein